MYIAISLSLPAVGAWGILSIMCVETLYYIEEYSYHGESGEYLCRLGIEAAQSGGNCTVCMVTSL